jgi:Mrp family chromosome partitioning ATPase
MISLYIVERSAEGRTKIVEQITQYLKDPQSPRISLKSLSVEEARFVSPPHIILVGEEIVGREVSEISKLKKQFPYSAIMARVPQALDNLSFIEQLARFGADEVVSASTGQLEFFRKVILLSKNGSKLKSGTLILVDGGKGGVGVTSVAAGLAETLVDSNKRVCLVDLDPETQDLSRFLQAKPFVNENLGLLLSQSQPIVEDTVLNSITQVWADDDRLSILTAPPDGDEIYESRNPFARLFLLVLEILDSTFDFVIVDVGHARGILRRSLYRVADGVVFVVNRDPAVLFASVERINRGINELAPDSHLVIVENGSVDSGLPSKILKKELLEACNLEDTPFISIPDCSSGRVWPGSGSTMMSRGKRSVRRAFLDLGRVFGAEGSDVPVRKTLSYGVKQLPAPVEPVQKLVSGVKLR